MKKVETILKKNVWLTIVVIFVATGAFGMGLYGWLKTNTVDKIKGAN